MPSLKKIMLVDNEAEIREAACVCLKDLGDFDVTLCQSGQEAIDSVGETKPQLILLDVMMPGMSGIMAFNRLRGIPEAKDTPIIFMTARAHNLQIHEYMEMGAAGVIAKPFDPLTIISEITAIWEKVANPKA